jgi:hypothetical protein
VDLDMAKELCFGQMVQNMRENGNMGRLMEKEFSLILKVKYMMVSGYMIKHMDLVYILIKMELNIKDIGTKIFNMVKVMKNGLMVLSSKENTEEVRKMDLENIFGQMELAMKENGRRMKLQDMVIINGQMVEDMLDIGKVI